MRLGLCSDGFTPFNHDGKAYSCWPVILTPYNLPPNMCLKREYMFLTIIIPGPSNPKTNIDVYLQPLIDDLKLLWDEGVQTYDVYRKENFYMRAALCWTINDFPAYGMLFGWSTAGKLGCLICMDHSKAFYLHNGRKVCHFDCHRQFLPMSHPFRKNKKDFLKGKVEMDVPPRRRSGREILEMIMHIPRMVDTGIAHQTSGYGDNHHWTKRSIFLDLPYWKDLLNPHNIDVMHTESNVFQNVFNTVMDIKGKTKDNVNARMDIRVHCNRPTLELEEMGNEKLLKPKAQYTLNTDQKQNVCKWVQGLKLPDGYASNLGSCVDLRTYTLNHMKSHDCHGFMQRLIPIAFSCLPIPIWESLTELSHFFRDLCSSILDKNRLEVMERNIPILLCKLEKIFPPSFFDVMEHLPIHLVYEAKVGGPVQYRWMNPFERFLHTLKKKVKNKAHEEGSICEAYLLEETSIFCSHYFEAHIHTRNRRVP